MVPDAILNRAKKFVETVRGQGNPVEAAYLFGSWVQGRATDWSGIDLAIACVKFCVRVFVLLGFKLTNLQHPIHSLFSTYAYWLRYFNHILVIA